MKVNPQQATTEDPEILGRFNQVLSETVGALEEAGIRYAFIGGIASGGLGRPRATRDIDVFVRPDDAEVTLRALAKHGFKTEKTDPSWLYKATKNGILVDVIFKSKGELYLDQEMYDRSFEAEFHGRQLRLVAPEDLIVIKALAHSELTPGHWHDALALLSRAEIDWDYLMHRARRAPRRVLSLLIYAQSNDLWVPKHVTDQLYQAVYGEQAPSGVARRGNFSQASPPKAPLRVLSPKHGYAVENLRARLAEDSRINELDIQIEQQENKLLLRGEVLTEERRQVVEQIARESCPSCEIENQIRVSQITAPTEPESMR